MRGHIKGFLLVAAMLGSISVAFRIVVTLESYAAVAIVAFLATVVIASIFWQLAMRTNVRLTYWTWGFALSAFTILRLSYPIEYDRSFGWTFVIGSGVALLSLATILMFKSSDRNERTR